MKYKDEIAKIIQDTIKLTIPMENLEIDTRLENVGLDSITFIRIVVQIEDCFDMEFPDDKLLLTQAGTIKDLCEIVMSVKE
jgi:acyl carrier protein